jgi:DNA-binding NarL/FixJ family response regulator
LSQIKIIIADSHFLSRKGLAVVLNENRDFTLVSEALSNSDLINQAKFYNPDLIIIDYTSANFSLLGLEQVVKK